ncbi:hypothetical protein JHK82_013520 [Glycine max]|uniref:Uncharacterized protein n=1 Tax=Glycine soja TaxID=3848 RepID=A0A445KRU5_GLYSO|nr:hypothetical protein JHK87_013441 [Glycine soja]KAG5058540.1 hypothetical protein JHK86_013536 [Glycine max]KAG5155551.1 hypothetical protein JHK82_013520 [Glycine max]RZC13448.1 hypothetical protein D0Y65_012873 [Glycine soja]
MTILIIYFVKCKDRYVNSGKLIRTSRVDKCFPLSLGKLRISRFLYFISYP